MAHPFGRSRLKVTAAASLKLEVAGVGVARLAGDEGLVGALRATSLSLAQSASPVRKPSPQAQSAHSKGTSIDPAYPTAESMLDAMENEVCPGPGSETKDT